MSESEVKEDDNETEHNSTTTPNPSEIKKKRKKRKKRSGKQGGYHRSSEDNADVCKIPYLFLSLSHDACACASKKNNTCAASFVWRESIKLTLFQPE